jgi:hypothetical protein
LIGLELSGTCAVVLTSSVDRFGAKTGTVTQSGFRIAHDSSRPASPIGADILRDRCLLLFVRNRFRDGPALQLESDPQAIGDHGPPLPIWKAPRNVAATIVIVTREHQAEGLTLGMSFYATYF